MHWALYPRVTDAVTVSVRVSTAVSRKMAMVDVNDSSLQVDCQPMQVRWLNVRASSHLVLIFIMPPPRRGGRGH